MTTISASTPLTDEQSDALDGTLPGILPDWTQQTMRPTRFFGITFAIIGVLLLLGVRIELFNVIVQFFAGLTGFLLDIVGLASKGAADAWANATEDQLYGSLFTATIPLIVAGIVLIGYGYGLGGADYKRRLPGRRVRYQVKRGYLERTQTVIGTATTVGANGAGVGPTVSSVTVKDPDWTVVDLRAWRSGEYSWSEQSETISSFENEDVDEAYTRLQAQAKLLDEAERLRLAGVYAGTTI
jgi:hypothetical protein